jgi:AcrR family transcriptional regulator
MRFEKGHKEATRQRIVEVAAGRFRREGIAAVGIAGIMADAGLTHGGFYAHFESKEDLVRAAIDTALAGTKARLDRAAAGAPSGLETYVRSYLRPSHRDHPEQGCTYAALLPELARHGDETRRDITGQLEDSLARIADLLPAGTPPEARQSTAISILGLLVGTLQMSRAVTDPALSASILDSGIAAALRLAGQPG